MDKSINKITIVSALYYIGRDKWKHSGFPPGVDRYKSWVGNLLSLDTCIHFFVDDFYHDYVVETRKKYDPELQKTVIVKMSFDELVFFKKYYNDESCLMSSPEFKSRVWFKDSADMNYPLYHIINFNKINFVKQASENNVFDSNHFFWVDAGGLRENTKVYENQIWPSFKEDIFNDKITHFSHNNFFELYPNKDQYFLSQTRNIQGTAWVVPKNLINLFHNLIDYEVKSIISEGIVGSDEKVYDFLYLNNKELYNIKTCGWFEFYNLSK